MIKSFRHKGPERFFRKNDSRGIQAGHAIRIERIPGLLDEASSPEQLNIPGLFLHRLGVSLLTVPEVIHKKRAVTPDMAMRLGRLLGNGPEIWL